MRKTHLIGTLLLALGLLAASGCKDSHDHAGHDHHGHDHAGHDHKHDHGQAAGKAADAANSATTAAAEVKFVNVLCPVGNEKINPASKHTVTVEHAGVTYGLCCADCIEPFKKEPAKYIAKLTEAGKEVPAGTPAMPAMQ